MNDEPAPTLVILSQFVVRPSASEEFMRRLLRTTRDRLGLPGVVGVTSLRDSGAPWRFALFEVFVDRRSAAARSESDLHTRWKAEARDLVVQFTEEQLDVLSHPPRCHSPKATTAAQ